MPDETIRYKVQIDDNDLPQQLANVRERVNQSMSAPFGVQGALPETAFGLGSATFNEQMRSSYAAISNRIETLTAPINQGYQVFSSDMQNLNMAANQGYQKFSTDVRQAFSPLAGGPSRFVDNPYDTGTGAFWGQLGFGYDQRSPEFRSEYMARNQEKVATDFSEAMTDATIFAAKWGAPIAAGVGAAALGASAALTGGVSLAVWGAAELATQYVDLYRERDRMTEGFRAIGQKQFGTYTEKQAENVANKIVDFTMSYEGRALDYSLQEITNVVTEFTAAGGYSQVRNAREFEQKTMDLVETFRTFAKTMGVFQEEAAQILGELERKNIANVGQSPLFGGYLQALGQQNNIAPMDLLQAGLQGTEIFRGTGLTAEAGFRSGLDARLETERLMKSSDPYYMNAVYNLGGPSGVQNFLMQNAMSYNQSGFGDIALGARFFGGGVGGGLNNNVETFSRGVSEPENWLRFLATKDFVASEFGMKGSNISMISDTMEQLRAVNMPTTSDNIVGLLVTQSRGTMSASQAWALLGSVKEMSPEEKDQAKKIFGGGMAAYMDAIAVDESASGTNVVNRNVLDKSGKPIAGGIYQFTDSTLRTLGYDKGTEKFADESIDYQNQIMVDFTRRNIEQINKLIAEDKLPGYTTIDINNITEEAAGLMAMFHYASPAGAISTATGGSAAGRPQVGGPPIDQYRDRFLERFRPRLAGKVPLVIPGLITDLQANTLYNTYRNVLEAEDIGFFDAVGAKIGGIALSERLSVGEWIVGAEKTVSMGWSRLWEDITDSITGAKRYRSLDAEDIDNAQTINDIQNFKKSETYKDFSQWREEQTFSPKNEDAALEKYVKELEKAAFPGDLDKIDWTDSQNLAMGKNFNTFIRKRLPAHSQAIFTLVGGNLTLGDVKDAGFRNLDEARLTFLKQEGQSGLVSDVQNSAIANLRLARAEGRITDQDLERGIKTVEEEAATLQIALADPQILYPNIDDRWNRAKTTGEQLGLSAVADVMRDQYIKVGDKSYFIQDYVKHVDVAGAKLFLRKEAEEEAERQGITGTTKGREALVQGIENRLTVTKYGGTDALFASVTLSGEVSPLERQMQRNVYDQAVSGENISSEQKNKIMNEYLRAQYILGNEIDKANALQIVKDQDPGQFEKWKKSADAFAKDPATLLKMIASTLQGVLQVTVIDKDAPKMTFNKPKPMITHK